MSRPFFPIVLFVDCFPYDQTHSGNRDNLLLVQLVSENFVLKKVKVQLLSKAK